MARMASEGEDSALIGSMMVELARMAEELKIASSGYRIVHNCNRDGGQTVGHLHFHLLGGRAMHWPPG
jgi:histidine triad (HIT) family protein